MWILFAFGSAFFAGMTAILAKCGIRKTDSTVAVSRVMFHEKLTCRSALGLALIVAGILAMLL